MVAVAKGRSDLVLLLIEKRADVNARSDDQKTALTIAESGGLTAIAEMLIKAGAKK
jgi:ankyrin repeat protein